MATLQYKYERLGVALRDLVATSEANTALPSVRELMKQYGVSQATVERGIAELHRDGLVRREPRAGIFVEERTPKPARTGTVTLIVPNLSSYGDTRIVDVVCRHADDQQINVDVCETIGSLAREQELLASIRPGSTDGILLRPTLAPSNASNWRNEVVSIQDVPLQRIDCPGDRPGALQFRHYAAARDAMRLLVEKGYRRIACITHFETADSLEIFNGIREGMSDCRQEDDMMKVHNLGRSRERQRRELKAIVADSPDAIVVAFSPFLYLLENEIADSGLSVPKDCLVVAVVDEGQLAKSTIPLLAIVRPVERLAQLGFERLLATIESRNLPPPRPLAAELRFAPEVEQLFATAPRGILPQFLHRTVSREGEQ